MKLFIIFLMTFIIPVRISSQEDYTFSNLITYGESEKLDNSFNKINGSQEFVYKFNLNETELNFVGYWTENFYSNKKQNGKNIRILGLDFYPNRIMQMATECFIDGNREKHDYFFSWKIEKNMLYLKLLADLYKTKNTIENTVVFNNSDYEIAGEVIFYKNNSILEKQFDFSFMNSLINEKAVQFDKDDFRYRMLLGQAMPSFYEKIGNNSKLKQFLLNFDTSKESDFIELKENYYLWD